MKKIIILLTTAFISAGTFAQAPQQMSYQTVIRDAGGALVASHSVGIKISVLQGGNIAYAETFTATTNVNGLLSLAIGTGTPVSGTFAGINWALPDDSIKTETDPTGGTSYTISGTSPLLSVPYALYAASSGGGAPVLWDTTGNNIYNSNSGNVGIGTSNPAYITDIVSTGGPRLRVFSQDNYFAGMLAQNNTHQYFVGCQGTWESASGTNSGFHIYDNTMGARRMVIDTAGNMGVGTSSPYNRLDIGGAMAIGAYAGNNQAPDSGLIVSGNVGIGTLSPLGTLHVVGEEFLSDQPALANVTSGFKIMPYGGVNYIESFGAGMAGGTGADLLFTNGNAANIWMDIKSTGNVGIGTTTPAATLEVNGQVQIDGGSPGVGKVLTSDANGLATWQPQGAIAYGFIYDNTGPNLSSGIDSISHPATGTYNIYCHGPLPTVPSVAATIWDTNSYGFISYYANGGNTISVVIRNSAGTLADESFSIIVFGNQ